LLSDFGKSTAPSFSTLSGNKSDGKPADKRSGFADAVRALPSRCPIRV